VTTKRSFEELKIHLIDLLGGRFDVMLGDVSAHLTHKATLLFYALCAAVLLVTDTVDVYLFYSAPVATVFWLFGLLCYITLYSPLLVIVALAQRRIAKVAFPLPVLCTLVLVTTLFLTSALCNFTTGVQLDFFAPSRALPLWLTAMVMETIFTRFVLPQVKEQTDTAKALAKAAQPRSIVIGNRKLRVDQIQHVAAQEHFVRIQLADSHILHRARLSDLVAQTQPEDGIQPHRSWWVSRSAKPRLNREGHRHVLVLEDETVVPVARTRLSEIENWLADAPRRDH
jgi:hypothetical protein